MNQFGSSFILHLFFLCDLCASVISFLIFSLWMIAIGIDNHYDRDVSVTPVSAKELEPFHHPPAQPRRNECSRRAPNGGLGRVSPAASKPSARPEPTAKNHPRA